MTNMSSINCVFKWNSAASLAGVFSLEGAHQFYSKNNIYDGNIAGTGSVIAGETGHISMVIKDDQIFNNSAHAATIYVKTLSDMHIQNTTFINNSASSNGAGIFIEISVKNFVCSKCVFMRNRADFEGILSINSADQIILSATIAEGNEALFGKMIEIKRSVETTVVSSDFKDNYCSGALCFLSIDKGDHLDIENCSFVSTEYNVKNLGGSSIAVHIKGKNVEVKRSLLIGTPGNLLKGVSEQNLYLKNVSCLCPRNHFFEREITNMSPDSSDSHALKTTGLGTINESSLIVKCILCAANHYKMGTSFYSLTESTNPSGEGRNDECYKCPPGGICKEHTVVADTNYWGFMDGNQLYFVFCPDGFCCQSSPCASYDTCNEGREGKLCTSCKDKYQLSIVSNDCLPKDRCIDGWVFGVILATGIAYIGFLLVKVEILNVYREVSEIVGRCFNRRRGRKHQDQANSVAIKVIREMEKENAVKLGESSTSNYGRHVSFQNLQNNPKATQNFRKSWEIPFDNVEIFHIIVFHLQDTSLFQIRFPNMPRSAFSFDEYKEKIVSVSRLESLTLANEMACFQKEATQVIKLFIKTSIIPFMIGMCFICMLLVKLSRTRKQIQNRLMSSANTVLLQIVLFSSQQLSTSALSLVKCVWLGSGDYLRINSTVECYQLWQWLVFGFILLFIFPFWLTLLIGPGLLRFGVISLRDFLLGLLFPGPFLFYSLWLLYRNRNCYIQASCPNMTTSAVLKEVWYNFKPFFSNSYLCWGGIIELRRLALVICATLIATRIARIVCMISVVIIAFAIHFKFHPYRDRTANACANVSLFATLMVGMLNFGWASFLYSGSSFEYGDAWDIGQGLITLEIVLIQVIPIGIILFCTGQFLLVNLIKRCK